jgi:hypothetical protein
VQLLLAVHINKDDRSTLYGSITTTTTDKRREEKRREEKRREEKRREVRKRRQYMDIWTHMHALSIC